MAHKCVEKPVIVFMHLVHEFVKIIFVSGAEIYESLDGLVGICAEALTLCFFDRLDGVFDERG